MKSEPFVIAVGLVLILAVAPGAAGQEPGAAALVRSVREREAWVERVGSLRIRADEHWVRSAQGVAKLTKDLQKQFPGADLSGFRDLKPEKDGRVDLAFDRSRVRLRVTTVGEDDDLRVWDGSRFVLAQHDESRPDRDSYLINRDPKQWLYWLLWTRLASFRAGPHRFWWHGEKEAEESARLEGKPEDFVYGGQAEYHGRWCHVVNRRATWTSLFIEVANGRLRGVRSGALTNPRTRVFALTRASAESMHTRIDPCFEFTLEDEKQVASGCWLPMTQTTVIFGTTDEGKPFPDLTRTVRITEATVNEPLPDSLFTVAFKEGAWVDDQTHDPPLRYRHKEKMPPEEWARIIAEGKARRTRDRAHEQKQSALIGKPGAPFPPEAGWLNSRPLEVGGLAGKLVILDFWAEWCGPCRNDLPGLSALHKRKPEDVVVIGVHPPGSSEEAIRKVMKDFDMQYPVCIDVPAPQGSTTWGTLFDHYGVDRIPHAVLLDRKGTVVATGELDAIIHKATELAGGPL